MPTLALDDLNLYFETHGQGPRLLIFNGSGGTIEQMRPLVTFLAGSFEVLIHDQRGLGVTGLPTKNQTATMATYASDARAVLDALGWPDVAVVGVSFGGMVAQEFAVTFPERVRRLALLCTSSGGAGGSSYPLHELADLDVAAREAASIAIGDTRFSADWLDAHPSDAALVAETVRRLRRDRTLVEIEGERLQLEARRHHDVWNRLGAITCPTFIAAGRYDATAPPENSAAIHSRVAQSELHLYEGGHAFLLQDLSAVGDLMRFLCAPAA